MAVKRMFSNKVLDTDAFLDMPLSAQALYFHLNLRADDDGFISSPKRIQSYIGASEDDLKLLVLKRFLIAFDDGVMVVKHWRMHNTIRHDRYTPTQYQEDLKMLGIKENNAYTLDFMQVEGACIQVGNSLATKWQPNGTTDIDIEKDIEVEKEPRIPAKEIIEYLNTVCGRHYKHDTASTLRLIKARINDGFTVDDFKRVIDKKAAKWGNDPKMAEYLRPETLFGTKFESYLNEPEAPKPKKHNFEGRDIDFKDLEKLVGI